MGKTSTVEVFSISDMQYFAYSAMATNPDTLILVICLMAFFIGPCLYISLYTIAYIIDCITLYSSPTNRLLNLDLKLWSAVLMGFAI